MRILATDETRIKHGRDGEGSQEAEVRSQNQDGNGESGRKRTQRIGNSVDGCELKAGGQAELGTNMGNHLKGSRVGKRRLERRDFASLSGQDVGKWTGFSHIDLALTRLCPHKSTQLVDFPHLTQMRLFWGRLEMVLATDETQISTDSETALTMREWREQSRMGWKSMKFFMVFRAFSRFITHNRPVITRFSCFLG